MGELVLNEVEGKEFFTIKMFYFALKNLVLWASGS